MDDDLADGRVERSEELILSEDLALRQHVHQRGLPYVGIADESDADELAAVLALHRHLAVDDLQLGLEVGDTVLDDTAVGLELRLPRATHPHTPTLALEVCPQAGQSGEHIAILSQLDLRLSVGRGSSGGEDIEDEARAVKDLDLQSLLNVAKLFGAELVVEDHDADLILLDEEADFLQLTLTDEGDGVGLIKALGEATYGSHTSCGGEEVQLVEIFAGLLLVLVLSDEPDEDRFLALGFSDDKLSHTLQKYDNI